MRLVPLCRKAVFQGANNRFYSDPGDGDDLCSFQQQLTMGRWKDTTNDDDTFGDKDIAVAKFHDWTASDRE